MSGWDPHRDLARLLEALAAEIVASGEPEVHAACLAEGDSIQTAAREVGELVGTFFDEPDEPKPQIYPIELLGTGERRLRHH
jgi:hypothetical protein